MYVCLSDDRFCKTSRRTFISAHPVYFQAAWVKFVYGHRVQVAGLKEVHNKYKQQMHPCQDKSTYVQCENSIANNSASITHTVVITHTVMKCVCSIDFQL